MISAKSLLVSLGLLSSLAQAGAIARRDGIANCDDTSTTYTGLYTDGEGTYATSDNVTHPYKFPAIRKCWYDYFVVTTNTSMDPWIQASGDIYCTGTSSCYAMQLLGTQTCQEHSVGISVSTGTTIEGITLGLDVTVTDSTSKCSTASDTTQCQWTDDACHVIWTQQQLLNQYGYRRKRCNWGHGDETDCMADWTQTTPTTLINYGCGSSCGDTNYCGNVNGTNC